MADKTKLLAMIIVRCSECPQHKKIGLTPFCKSLETVIRYDPTKNPFPDNCPLSSQALSEGQGFLKYLFDTIHQKKEPRIWAEEMGVSILDPDGWRKDQKSFDKSIGLLEFIDRLMHCTISRL